MKTRFGLSQWRTAIRIFTAVLLSSVFLFQQTASAYDALARKTPFYDPTVLSCGTAGGTLSGSDNRAKIFNYLLGKMVNGKPLQNYHVAGIMGNMKSESGFEPQRLQGIYDRLVPSDQVFPTSPASNPTVSKTGWGVVQWTPYTKVIDPLTSAGKNANDLQTQLDFLLEQLNGGTQSSEKAAGDAIVAATNVADATVAFELKYERHAGAPQPQRVINAEEILNDVQSGAIAPATAGGGSGSSIYVLGDSLTVGMRDAGDLQNKLTAQGQSVVKINAIVGKPIQWGIDQVNADSSTLSTTSNLLVGLGTNNVGDVVANNGTATVLPAGVTRVKQQMQDLISRARAANPNIHIYWTDFYGKGILSTSYGRFNLDAATGALNPALREVASSSGVTVLPWSSSQVASSYVPVNDVHPNGHYPAMADFIVDALKQAIGATTATSGAEKPVIVLDPGHGLTTINRIDPQTGLHDGDYNNDAERKQVYAVAQMVKQQLEQAGYQVVLTKDTAEQSVFLRDRANVGNNAHATLGISIHTQGDKAFGTWQEIYVQKVGLYRGTGANKQTFTDASLAQKSQEYARIMKDARDSTEVTSGTTVITDNSFDGRTGGIEPGNIPLVELWANVPWIYLEAGGNNLTSGLTDQQKGTYANAIVAGVKKAVPTTGATGASSCGGNTQGLANTITTYAWPDYRGSGYTTMKPEYAAAVAAARTARQYIGGVSFPGVDCGGFVTRTMVNSGYEPNYNYGASLANGAGNTVAQLAWVKANWQLVGRGNTLSTADLKQGDVAFRVTSDGSNDGHTFMYAGEIPNFGSKIASASLDDRAPMAGAENPLASNVEWYRKK